MTRRITLVGTAITIGIEATVYANEREAIKVSGNAITILILPVQVGPDRPLKHEPGRVANGIGRRTPDKIKASKRGLLRHLSTVQTGGCAGSRVETNPL